MKRKYAFLMIGYEMPEFIKNYRNQYLMRNYI